MSSSRPRIALITAQVARAVDEDLAPLGDALTEHGAAVSVVDWDDDGVDWSSFDLAVIRSTWDYCGRLDEFLVTIERIAAATTLWNPVPIVRWNSDKRYLNDLSAQGISVVASTFLEPGESVTLPSSGEYVVKPSVSAGSRDTARFGPDEESAAHRLIDHIWRSDRTVMVQPYQSAVDREGEVAVLWFGGTYSHSIRKGPLLQRGTEPTRALFAQEHITSVEPTAAHLELAERTVRVVAARFADALSAQSVPYARVDMVQTDDGLAVLETELVEPSVFLHTAPESAGRFAASLLAGLRRPAS